MKTERGREGMAIKHGEREEMAIKEGGGRRREGRKARQRGGCGSPKERVFTKRDYMRMRMAQPHERLHANNHTNTHTDP